MMAKGDNRNRNIIITVVVLILLCCCCSIGSYLAWVYGDQFMEMLAMVQTLVIA